MIDLHTHTTASDGRCTPTRLVEEAWRAGLRVLGIVDHDTTLGLDEAREQGAAMGVRIVPGIEITASEGGRDIHVLGYFLDDQSPALQAFLSRQRAARVERVREIGARLARLGCRLDVEALVRSASREGQSIGRPAVAAALVAAGHVGSEREAFDRYLAEGRPASIPRSDMPVQDIVEVVHAAGGVASLAHPGLNDRDAAIPGWTAAGLDAIEVYHSEHGPDEVARYREIADRLNLLVTGGSDFHGDARAERARLGQVTLPEAEFTRLLERQAARR